MPVVLSLGGSAVSATDGSLRQTPRIIGAVVLLCHLAAQVGQLRAEVVGPERPPLLPSISWTTLSADGRFAASLPPADTWFGDLPRRWTLSLEEEREPETMERVSGEEKGPRIPEPMVFDLVRPLGATRARRNSIRWVWSPSRAKRAGWTTCPIRWAWCAGAPIRKASNGRRRSSSC
ncbi:MAG: hypothetical protein AB1555_06720 [Nitrospirota bacterium]